MRLINLILVFLFSAEMVLGEVAIRQTLILTKEEQTYLRNIIQTNARPQHLWEQVREEAEVYLNDVPDPLKTIHYEGLLDTNPKRVGTETSLEDMDKSGCLLFAYYGSGQAKYARKAKEIILAWAGSYRATGNPINENKFEPFMHCYYAMQQFFNGKEREKVDNWLKSIADAEMANKDIPMNNWEAKRIKIVSLIGLILGNQQYINFGNNHFKKYIDHSLYEDGTTRDLHHRDALGYHVSGLKPLMVYAITLEQTKKQPGFNPFTYKNVEGGSIRKSVDYVNPYAKGEKVHKEWVNTQVQLDKDRAEAGLEKYQPGTLFKPKEALGMYELACFFDSDYQNLINAILKEKSDYKYHNWFFLLVKVAGR